MQRDINFCERLTKKKTNDVAREAKRDFVRVLHLLMRLKGSTHIRQTTDDEVSESTSAERGHKLRKALGKIDALTHND
jgi:hypothetical protein